VRVGIGYDSHAFAPKRKGKAKARQLILGGVEIPHDRGLLGHSDADAVAHAVTDALLGAAGLGDIGRMFPNDDPRWTDANSIHLLNLAFLKVVEAGFQFVHADVTIIAEQPKLAPHVDAMEAKIAEAVLAGPAHVSIKAKTNEGMGWIGRGEGIAVLAVATLAESSGPRLSGGSSGILGV
jgi:2-C-methyl-D-erythritol 2,4-cyclodiphosphate synthase